MAGTIKLPGIGAVQSKHAIAGGAVVVGIAGFAWVRHMNAGAAAEAEPASADFTEGGDYVYGDPGMSAYATDYAYDGGAYPYPSGGSYGNTSNPPVGRDPVTNPEWTQRAIEHLEMVGVESQVASLSVSRYLLKECVTATQGDNVRQAVAALGPPPQGVFSILICGGGGGGTSPPPPSSGYPSGATLPAPGGLRVVNTWSNSIQVDWSAVPNAKGYAVYVADDPRHDGKVPRGVRQRGSVLYDGYTVKGLKPGRYYRIDVHAIGHDNKIGARARTYAGTKKK